MLELVTPDNMDVSPNSYFKKEKNLQIEEKKIYK